MREPLTVLHDGLKISGQLYLPESGQAPYPLIIISHGFGGSRNSNLDEAQWFCEQGIAAFIYDFIGGGMNIQSDGNMTDMSVLTEVEDLKCVINALIARDDIDETHLFLMGKSQGGFVSSYVAGKMPELFKGVILYYPAFVLQDDAKERMNTKYAHQVMAWTIGDIYNRDATSFDIYDVIDGYKNKVIIIHGDEDSIVPFSYAQKAFETYDQCDLICMKHAGHGFTGEQKTAAFDYALSYVKQRL